MKNYLAVILLLGAAFILAGCQSVGASQPENGDAAGFASETWEAEAVDVDLTRLSSTIAYAEAYSILTGPDAYMGKTIKVSGRYFPSYFSETGLNYHFVLIDDATSCCQQGFEFIWNGDRAVPDDYPEKDTEIELVGQLQSYKELGNTYCYLAVDEIIVLNKPI